MRRSYLGLLAVALGYAVFQNGGSNLTDWNVCVLLIAMVAAVFWLLTPDSDLAPTLPPWLAWAVFLIPCYVALQLIPLPMVLLRILSPDRAAITDRLAPVTGIPRFVPLSLSPELTFAYLFRIVAATALFLLIREMAWRSWRRRSWSMTLPLIAIAALEAVLGIVQKASAATVQGTYANKNHLAGLLEMVLPIALAYGLAALMNHDRTRAGLPVARILRGATFLGLAVLIAVGLIASVSKMGFVAGLCGLFAMGALGFWTLLRGWTRWLAAAALVVAFLFLLVFVPSDELMKSFAGLFSDEWSTGEGRWPIWRDTLRLIRDYPFFGCGLGAYQTVFQKYQTAVIDREYTFAHNDYLQILAELGVVGSSIAAALILFIFVKALRAATRGPDRETRYLGLGCVGALTAIGIHSVTDFNMYIPANVLVLAWIAGITASLPSLPERPVPVRKVLGRVFFKRFAIALAGLLILFAPAWILFETNFKNEASAERRFCRFGICDTDAVLDTQISEHGGSVSAVPVEDLLEALRGDVAAPNRWCDLGEALLKTGRVNQARYSIQTAVALGPYIPPILRRATSFYFSLHDNKLALEQSARVLDKTDSYDDLIFQSYRANQVPVSEILSNGLLGGRRASQAYLRYLIGIEHVDEAATVWNWELSHNFGDERLAREYVNFLFADQLYEKAAQAWALFLDGRSDGYLQSNWMFNGDFETEPTRMAFDWTIENLGEDVQIVRDGSVAHTGKYSLRVRFGGKENVNYRQTWERAFVRPGNYRFEAFIRTQDITTDRGIGFHIVDSENQSHLDVKTGQLIGTNDWTKIEQPIHVPEGAKLLTILIIREPSLKFDNQIGGTAWIDSLRLVRLDSEGTSP